MSESLYQKADGIIDLRSREDFVKGHLHQATWLPFEILAESLNHLPAAPATLFLVGDKNEIEEASLLLDVKGYQVNGSLVLNESTLAFWQASLADHWQKGKTSKRLWQPAPIIASWVETYLPAMQAKASQRLKVLDLGCGGGRDAVFLAQQRLQVVAIEKEARVLKRAKALASHSGASVKFKCCDLAKADCLPAESFDLIIGIRFLNRALLPQLADKLNPGGYLIWETFVETEEPLASPKNPNFILQPDELAEVFASLEIITDKIQKLSDGRPVKRFIAQKSE